MARSLDSSAKIGGLYALAAYLSWGLAPLFWKTLTHEAPFALLCFRVVFAALFFAALLAARGRWHELRRHVEARTIAIFSVSAALLAVNWFVFVFAVDRGAVLQASLGYFINPILNVVLGMVFLHERLRPGQWLAVALAAAGVGVLAMPGDSVPWLALILAGSFGFYGLVRKTAPADALVGSNLEAAVLIVPALFWLMAFDREAAAGRDLATWLLLVASGAITALPLLWFSNAARRLSLTTLGFFQYIAPTSQFLLAVLVFDEPFTSLELRSFALIWAGLLVFSLESRLELKRRSAS